MKYLHQYTNVNALKSILANKTIRLRPLSTLDDLEEALSKDCRAIGDFVLVSSWSEVSEEMIPMWFMYGDQCKGVRIGLPENPFTTYHYTPEEQAARGVRNIKGDLTTNIPLEDLQKPDYCVIPWHADHFLRKIEYTDNEELLHPQVRIENERGDYNFSYGKMGRYKSLYWEFQREYRYTLNVMPFAPAWLEVLATLGLTDAIKQRFNDMADGKIKRPLEYYDLHIDPDMFDRMEIILGPLMTEKDAEEITMLINNISKRILVKHSSLKDKIRSKSVK